MFSYGRIVTIQEAEVADIELVVPSAAADGAKGLITIQKDSIDPILIPIHVTRPI